MSQKSPLRKFGESFRAEGVALAIPMVLLTFPVGGAFVGRWLEGQFGVSGLTVAGLLLGLAMGIKEAVRLIRQLNRIQK
jgi:hypothetical protein